MDYLKNRNGLSRHTEIVRLVTLFYKHSRAKGEDLVSFVDRFDKSYKEVENLTIPNIDSILQMSSTGKALIMLTACNLADINYQISTKGIKSDDTEKARD